jgi:hypothetical protein
MNLLIPTSNSHYVIESDSNSKYTGFKFSKHDGELADEAFLTTSKASRKILMKNYFNIIFKG